MTLTASPATPLPGQTLRVGQYLRVSKDRTKRGISVDQQRDDNEAVAADEGWKIVETYIDNDRSASRYATRVREDFPRLIADLRLGRLDVLILWESSRGSRQVEEWIEMINLATTRGTRFYITTHERIYDPAIDRDRKALLEDAIDSEYEASKTRTRILRSANATAQKGKPWGRCPYGYKRIYDYTSSKRQLKQVPNPDEAEVVKRIYKDLNRGVPLAALARALNADGIRPREAPKWVAPLVRDIALREAYIGKRFYKGALINGTWDAIIDEAVYWAVKQRLTSPERKTTVRPGKAAHLLSMIVQCAVCDQPLVRKVALSKSRTGKVGLRTPSYVCNGSGGGHVSINQANVDHFVAMMVCNWFHAHWDEYTAGEINANDEAALAAQGEVVHLEVEMDQRIQEAVLSGATGRAVAIMEQTYLKRISDARERGRETATPLELRWMFDGPEDEIAARWDAAPMAARREVVRKLFAAIKVRRRVPGQGYHGPVKDRVDLTWREMS